ncbi:MAG: hypothetical protein H0X50_08385 [Nitrosopumilus sp.]|nr:hypothetical protein [Nitrosopumilus sp.]
MDDTFALLARPIDHIKEAKAFMACALTSGDSFDKSWAFIDSNMLLNLLA